MNNKMRIVLVTEKFNPRLGYLEYYLAVELVKLNHEVIVVSYNSNTQSDVILHHEGFYTLTIPSRISLGGYHFPTLSGITRIIRFVGKVRPAVVHCQPIFSPLSLVFAACKALFGYKVVGSLVTGGPVVVTSGLFNTKSLKSMLKFIMAKFAIDVGTRGRIDLYFALSKSVRRMLLKHFRIPRKRISIVHLGADPSLFQFSPELRTKVRIEIGLSNSDLVVVIAGKIIPAKGVDLLIRAMVPIIRKEDNVRLLIVGSGDPLHLNYLEKLVLDNNISSEVFFHPPVHRTDLPGFFCASDIAVWPGGPSMSLIEAASVGLPLIIMRSPFSEYLVRNNNGYSIAPGDENDLRIRLESLIRNRDIRIQMGRRSRQLVEEKLSWKTIAGCYAKEYERLFG